MPVHHTTFRADGTPAIVAKTFLPKDFDQVGVSCSRIKEEWQVVFLRLGELYTCGYLRLKVSYREAYAYGTFASHFYRCEMCPVVVYVANGR